MLATGSQLIEDVRRAPEEALSFSVPMKEVRWRAKWRSHTHMDCLVSSIEIYAGPIERE